MIKNDIADATAGHILDRLSDLKNYPREALVPYEKFEIEGKTYYFTPGGFLYRKDPGSDKVRGYFCGYLTGEVWHYRSTTTTVGQDRREVA